MEPSKTDPSRSEGLPGDDEEDSSLPPRFPPEEEAACTKSQLQTTPLRANIPYANCLLFAQSLVSESNEKKSEANALFSSAKYESAINKYEEAATICPHYLDYELAVLKSNIAACHLKLEQYKEAIQSATDALESLSRSEKAALESAKKSSEDKAKDNDGEDEPEAKMVSAGAQKSAPAISKETDAQQAARRGQDDVLRIKAKALMRRARARSELGGWSNLSGAEEDYKTLSTMSNLTSTDERIVRSQLRTLPARVKVAQEKEMGEMWGKLKDVSALIVLYVSMFLKCFGDGETMVANLYRQLGNGILKPFGLSTDNFQMVKDEKTGGYSMNFNQNQKPE